MKKVLFSLLVITSCFTLVGCGKEENKENKKEQKQEQKEETKQERPTTNNKVGDLSFYIPDSLKLNTTSSEDKKVYSINTDTTNISVWVVRIADYSGSVLEYMDEDPWDVDTSRLDKQKYNGQEWTIQPQGEFKLYTKYKNDIYKIRFSVLEDGTNMLSNLKKQIPKSLIFD